MENEKIQERIDRCKNEIHDLEISIEEYKTCIRYWRGKIEAFQEIQTWK